MKFETPLIRGILLKRYKRFMADIELEDKSIITAHCPNSGSMLSINVPGSTVWISKAKNPNRKLKYTLELICIKNAIIGENTNHPNNLVSEAIVSDIIPELSGYTSLRREVKYGENSRIDILLQSKEKPDCYVEVKNVTMRRDNLRDSYAEFPDSITSRGKKHLCELSKMRRDGYRGVMLFLVQRNDIKTFGIASDIDPEYAEALSKAIDNGVEVFCYDCILSTMGISVNQRLKVNLK